jgi:hypothetical protein
MEGWQKHYVGMVEWLAPKIHEGVKSVDPETNTVVTGFEIYKAALVSAIPAQTVGKIARDAGLANPSGFRPTDPASMNLRSDVRALVQHPNAALGNVLANHPRRVSSVNAKVGSAGVWARALNRIEGMTAREERR